MFDIIKRCYDFFFSIIALIFFSPFLVIVIIISFFIQGFPVFFFHKRLGLNGKSFQMIKFRTMKNGPSLSAKDDERRLTRYGRFLRITSIDELPVLINVIKGEMSLVGPRPMPIKYLARFNKDQIKRLEIKPGLTGLAQVEGRNRLSWEDKFKLDVDYINRKSIIFDFIIILKTLFVVISREGIKSANSEIMPEFMGTKDRKNEIS